jgi:hypothetical protein
VVVTLRDYATTASEEYRVGIDVVLRDLVDTFCNDNDLKSPTHPPRVTFRGKPVSLYDTMKTLGVTDRDVVHVVRDHPATPPKTSSSSSSSTPSSAVKPIYTIDD